MFSNKKQDTLKGNKLFQKENLSKLKFKFSQKNYQELKSGEIVYSKGELADKIYLIIDGEAKLKISGGPNGHVIVNRKKDDFFGEIEILEKRPRKTSAVAITDLQVYKLTAKELDKIIIQSRTVKSNIRAYSYEEGSDNLDSEDTYEHNYISLDPQLKQTGTIKFPANFAHKSSENEEENIEDNFEEPEESVENANEKNILGNDEDKNEPSEKTEEVNLKDKLNIEEKFETNVDDLELGDDFYKYDNGEPYEDHTLENSEDDAHNEEDLIENDLPEEDIELEELQIENELNDDEFLIEEINDQDEDKDELGIEDLEVNDFDLDIESNDDIILNDQNEDIQIHDDETKTEVQFKDDFNLKEEDSDLKDIKIEDENSIEEEFNEAPEVDEKISSFDTGENESEDEIPEYKDEIDNPNDDLEENILKDNSSETDKKIETFETGELSENSFSNDNDIKEEKSELDSDANIPENIENTEHEIFEDEFKDIDQTEIEENNSSPDTENLLEDEIKPDEGINEFEGSIEDSIEDDYDYEESFNAEPEEEDQLDIENSQNLYSAENEEKLESDPDIEWEEDENEEINSEQSLEKNDLEFLNDSEENLEWDFSNELEDENEEFEKNEPDEIADLRDKNDETDQFDNNDFIFDDPENKLYNRDELNLTGNIVNEDLEQNKEVNVHEDNDSEIDSVPEESEINPPQQEQIEEEGLNRNQLKRIIEVLNEIHSKPRIDEIIDSIEINLEKLTLADKVKLFLIDPEHDNFVLLSKNNNEPKELFKLGQGLVGLTSLKNESINIKDAASDKRFDPSSDSIDNYEIKNILCYPLRDDSGNVNGVIQLFNKKENKFDELDEETLEVMSPHIVTAIKNTKSIDKLLFEEKLNSFARSTNFLTADIKQPVLSIKHYASHIKNQNISDEQKQVLNLLIEQSNNIVDLIQTASGYSENKNLSEPIKVSLNESLNWILSLLAEYVESRNVVLYKKLDKDINVKLDKKTFLQACFQIAKNSCDAMKEGGNIYVITKRDNDKIKLEFKDSGTGMPDEILEDIFEPFFSYNKNGSAGLGLAITNKIIHEHNGNIFAENNDVEGVKIVISLPVTE